MQREQVVASDLDSASRVVEAALARLESAKLYWKTPNLSADGSQMIVELHDASKHLIEALSWIERIHERELHLE